MPNIMATAAEAGTFHTFASTLQASDLLDTVNGPEPLTVFAPTDDVFARLPSGAVDGLLADRSLLNTILGYHLVPGKLMAADVTMRSYAITAEEGVLRLDEHDGTVTVNDATVTRPDISADNGVIHAIDKLLLPVEDLEDLKLDYSFLIAAPPAVAAEVVLPPPPILEILNDDDRFRSLVTYLRATGLIETLSGPGPFTLLAPINAAFDALPRDSLHALRDDISRLTKVLTYHLITGQLTAAAALKQQHVTTVEGRRLMFHRRDSFVTVDQATVVRPDIEAGNGIIHVIDTVLFPYDA